MNGTSEKIIDIKHLTLPPFILDYKTNTYYHFFKHLEADKKQAVGIYIISLVYHLELQANLYCMIVVYSLMVSLGVDIDFTIHEGFKKRIINAHDDLTLEDILDTIKTKEGFVLSYVIHSITDFLSHSQLDRLTDTPRGNIFHKLLNRCIAVKVCIHNTSEKNIKERALNLLKDSLPQ